MGESSRGASSFFSPSAWVRDGQGGRAVRRAIDAILACQGLDPPPPSVPWRRPNLPHPSPRQYRGGVEDLPPPLPYVPWRRPNLSHLSPRRYRGGVADLPPLGRHRPEKFFFSSWAETEGQGGRRRRYVAPLVPEIGLPLNCDGCSKLCLDVFIGCCSYAIFFFIFTVDCSTERIPFLFVGPLDVPPLISAYTSLISILLRLLSWICRLAIEGFLFQ